MAGVSPSERGPLVDSDRRARRSSAATNTNPAALVRPSAGQTPPTGGAPKSMPLQRWQKRQSDWWSRGTSMSWASTRCCDPGSWPPPAGQAPFCGKPSKNIAAQRRHIFHAPWEWALSVPGGRQVEVQARASCPPSAGHRPFDGSPSKKRSLHLWQKRQSLIGSSRSSTENGGTGLADARVDQKTGRQRSANATPGAVGRSRPPGRPLRTRRGGGGPRSRGARTPRDSVAIGAPGFEPGTSPTRTARATRLRHAPMRRSV